MAFACIVGACACYTFELVGAFLSNVAVLLTFVAEDGLAFVFLDGDSFVEYVDVFGEEAVTDFSTSDEGCRCRKGLVGRVFADGTAPGH